MLIHIRPDDVRRAKKGGRMEGQMNIYDIMSRMNNTEIVSFVPVGHRNAIGRKNLSLLTGKSDRDVRRMIHEARRVTVILNLLDGSGYFRPDMNDPEDVMYLRRYIQQEESRLKSCEWALKAAREAIRGHDI